MSGKRKRVEFVVSETGCHLCTSHHLNKFGYPCVFKDGRNQNLHRVLYEEEFGKLPAGYVVRHKCDTPACIKLDHLEPGTPAENSGDCKKRGRTNPPRGERSGTAKLSLKEVLEILEASEETQHQLACRYGVSQSTISRIKSKKRWSNAGTD